MKAVVCLSLYPVHSLQSELTGTWFFVPPSKGNVLFKRLICLSQLRARWASFSIALTKFYSFLPFCADGFLSYYRCAGGHLPIAPAVLQLLRGESVTCRVLTDQSHSKGGARGATRGGSLLWVFSLQESSRAKPHHLETISFPLLLTTCLAA